LKKTWDILEHAFPDWEIHHTGGGIFVLRKDFKNKFGNDIMVAVSEDVALIMKNYEDSGKFLSHSQFLENETIYWQDAFELEVSILMRDKSEIIIADDANIFEAKVLEDIKSVYIKLEEIIWQ